MTLLNPLRATSYRPPVMKTWQPQPKLNHEHINLQQLKPGWKAKLERKEVWGLSFLAVLLLVQSLQKGWCGPNVYPPWICIHAPGKPGTLAYRGGREKKRREGQVLTWWQGCGGCEGGSTALRPRRKMVPLSHRRYTPWLNMYMHGFRMRDLTGDCRRKSSPEAIVLGEWFQNHHL